MATVDATFALVTLADLKVFLKITGGAADSKLSFLINEISKAVNTFVGHFLLSKTYTEYYNGDGSRELMVKNFPIISITSLHNADSLRTFDGSTVIDVSADVLINKPSAILELWNDEAAFLRGRANIKLVYTAGYAVANIPNDIQLAVKKWAAQQYLRLDKRRHDIQSESIAQRTVTYLDRPMPDEVKFLLQPYRRYGGYAEQFAFAD